MGFSLFTGCSFEKKKRRRMNFEGLSVYMNAIRKQVWWSTFVNLFYIHFIQGFHINDTALYYLDVPIAEVLC